ncbi:MAG: hypothetical protein EB084_20240 [Proteobacteria bacterium]|nr:hypothetical protein [Pseudomonadota bacterium]
MGRVVLLWGAPAAGKTSVARAVVASCARADVTVLHLSSDAVRAALHAGPYLRALQGVVYDGLQAMLESAMAAGLTVLLDANYLDAGRRGRVRAAVASRGGSLLSVQVACSVGSRRARNDARPLTQQVPADYIEDAHGRAEAQQGDADVVVDTDTCTADEAARRITRWFLEGQVSLPGDSSRAAI